MESIPLIGSKCARNNDHCDEDDDSDDEVDVGTLTRVGCPGCRRWALPACGGTNALTHTNEFSTHSPNNIVIPDSTVLLFIVALSPLRIYADSRPESCVTMLPPSRCSVVLYYCWYSTSIAVARN